jgi:hypothetical protein
MKFTLTEEQQLLVSHYFCSAGSVTKSNLYSGSCRMCPLRKCYRGSDGAECTWLNISLCDETIITAIRIATKEYPQEFKDILKELPFISQIIKVQLR